MVELIPGTTLPFHAPSAASQPEGRGEVKIIDERMPHSLFEKIERADGISPAEAAIAGAALRAFDRHPRKLKVIFDATNGQTDATTGNCVIPLFEVPAGAEGHLVSVTVDTPNSATITPTAPYTNAASWGFLAKGPVGSTSQNASALALRPGLVAFAPSSTSTLPVLPYQWTFEDTNAPVGFGGTLFYYVLVGGSIAATKNISLRTTFRVNLYQDT